MISMDYTAHLTFNDFGYADKLIMCNVSTHGTYTVSICDQIPPHLKSKQDVKFGVDHVLVKVYKNLIRNEDNKKGVVVVVDPQIGTVDLNTFYCLRRLWPNVTRLPSENIDQLRKEMVMNIKDHTSIVYMTFNEHDGDMPLSLCMYDTKEPYEVTRLDLNSFDDEPLYKTLKDNVDRRYEVRHRILDFYEDDWNVGTKEVKTFEYLQKTWPKISFLGQFDIGKAMVELTAKKYKRENGDVV